MSKELINLTPHEITLVRKDGEKVVIPPSGKVARVRVEQKEVGEIDGFPVVQSEFGEVEGLPEEREGVIYIVSFPVLQALQGTRSDVVAPDTSPQGAVRDEQGRIIGVKRFQVLRQGIPHRLRECLRECLREPDEYHQASCFINVLKDLL